MLKNIIAETFGENEQEAINQKEEQIENKQSVLDIKSIEEKSEQQQIQNQNDNSQNKQPNNIDISKSQKKKISILSNILKGKVDLSGKRISQVEVISDEVKNLQETIKHRNDSNNKNNMYTGLINKFSQLVREATIQFEQEQEQEQQQSKQQIEKELLQFVQININQEDLCYDSREAKISAKHIQEIRELRDKYLFKGHQNYQKLDELKKNEDINQEPKYDYLKRVKLLQNLNLDIQIKNGVFVPVFTKQQYVDFQTNKQQEQKEEEQKILQIMTDATISEQDLNKFNNKVLSLQESIENEETISFEFIPMLEFIQDYVKTLEVTHNKIVRSFCYKRLQILGKKYDIHLAYNQERERLEQQNIKHRDFNNTRKVDTHIHHSAMMTGDYLVKFIKRKMQEDQNKPVLKDKQGNTLTLQQVMDKLNMNDYTITLDSLNVYADSTTFQRFDNFNSKYNPLGAPELREIFLKSENFIDGQYLAEITREIMQQQDEEKNFYSEWRISVYGKKISEWSALAKWILNNNLTCDTNRWMIQVPRIYNIYKKCGAVQSFQDILTNVFLPLFEVTINPSVDPDLYQFLLQVTGFDSVDDEDAYEDLNILDFSLTPSQYTKEQNPHYAYWGYYLYANLYTLNQLRKERGLNTFHFRPHCGESGNINHLATAFLLSNGINHGIVLDKTPVLQYLYYLEQIGISVSPLSNDKLFLKLNLNPFKKFFTRGLNVTLSTDDPLIMHLTKQPLLEEYVIAQQAFNLNLVDLCEIAKNSILCSSFEENIKRFWLGPQYDQFDETSNVKEKTNIPSIRHIFRINCLRQEKQLLESLIQQ